MWVDIVPDGRGRSAEKMTISILATSRAHSRALFRFREDLCEELGITLNDRLLLQVGTEDKAGLVRFTKNEKGHALFHVKRAKALRLVVTTKVALEKVFGLECKILVNQPGELIVELPESLKTIFLGPGEISSGGPLDESEEEEAEAGVAA